VLDRILRWQGSRTAPVDLKVCDTLLALTMEYYSAEVVLDPHQAVLIAQEARTKGVIVHEFPFNATLVGRLALSLHQAIRNHRVACYQHWHVFESGTVTAPRGHGTRSVSTRC
jgi:hypothetical protein